MLGEEMETRTKHVGEERLEAYATNSLAEDEVAVVEEHLLICSTCQDRLDAVEHYLRAMEGAAKRIRAEESRALVPGVWERVLTWVRRPIAAGGLAVAGVTVAGLILLIRPHLREQPGAPVDIELQAVRGATFQTAQAGHALHLHLDGRGVPEMRPFQIEIVDEEGAKIWRGSGTASDSVILANVDQSFKPGTYFVRLLKEGSDPIREYQLLVQ
jgi:hypothetical protein